MARIFFFLFMLLLGHFSFAAGEGQVRFGGQAGHLGYAQKIGNSDPGNAIGAGGIFNYGVTEEMMFELTYTASSHTNLNHTDFGAGLNFFFNSYDAAFMYVAAGANFITHKVDVAGASQTANGFGLYGGIGVDFDLGKNFSTGIQALYHNSFGANLDIAGTSVNVVPSYTTVMLRLLFVIPGGS